MSEKQPIPTTGEHKRANWSSRIAFYFAAVGAAVGFGTLCSEQRELR